MVNLKFKYAVSSAFLAAIGLGASALLTASSASAAAQGATASCSAINPNRFQCNFPAPVVATTLTIEYVSMQCGTTGTPFSLQEFQVLATPPGSASEVAYQIPISVQPSVGGVVNAGSPVTIFAQVGSTPRALIDLTPAFSNPGTQCTVSYAGK